MDLGFPASSKLQGVPAPEMVNCVIWVDVVGIVVGTTHAKLSLVQQVPQLSPASQSVFRVGARHGASPAAALNVFAAHAVQLPSGPVYPAGHGALALQSVTAVDPVPAVVLPGGQLHDGSCS